MAFKFIKSAPIGRIFPAYKEVWGDVGDGARTLEWSAVSLNSEIISIGGLLCANPRVRIELVATTKGRRRVGAALFLLRAMYDLHSPTWGETFEFWCDSKNTAAIGLITKAGYEEKTQETVTTGTVPKMARFVGPGTRK